MRWLLLALLLAVAPASALPLLVASETRLQPFSHYFGVGIDSRCGADWFFLRWYSWQCARRRGEILEVYSEGGFVGHGVPGLLWYLLHPPTPVDRRLYIISHSGFGPWMGELDPLTLTTGIPRFLAQGVRFPPSYVDHDADGHRDLLMWDAQGALVMSLPGGDMPGWTVVRRYLEKATLAGQFDQDPQSELALIESGVLRFIDSASGLPEALQVPGPPVSPLTEWIGDWDGDGRDEIAFTVSAAGRLFLVDPDQPRPPVQVDLGGDRPVTVLGRIDWDGDGLPELMLASESHAAILDPRTGGLLRNDELAPRSQNGRRHGQPLDWDADGDQDFVWAEPDSQVLLLMRNPTGPELVQRGPTSGRVVGYALRDGRSVLVVAQSAGSGVHGKLELRQLDPETLEQLEFAVVPNLGYFADVQIGDVHPDPGSEIVVYNSLSARTLALDGTPLWMRTTSSAGWSLTGLSVGDSSCYGPGCAPVLVVERPGSPSTYRLIALDGRDGSELWTVTHPYPSPEPTPHPATDLDGDGEAELLWTNSGRLEARKADGSLAWRIGLPGNSTPTRVRQSPFGLGVLYADTTLELRSPVDGSLIASTRLAEGGQCPATGHCDLEFLATSANAGTWVVGGGEPDFLAVRHDLSGPVETLATESSRFDNLAALAPDRLHAGDIAVFGYRYDPDHLARDGFEDR